MAKKYDLVVKTGEYTDSSGEVKARYQNVGVVMENDKGPYMLLNRTFNPAGVPGNADRDNIIVSMFEPKDDRGSGGGSSSGAPRKSAVAMDDDIPFVTMFSNW
jgi:hypothetical protein